MSDTKTPPAFDWTTLPDPVKAPTRPAFIREKVDVITEIPAPIRERAEVALTETVKRIAANATSQAKRKRVDPAWELQPVSSTAVGDQFVALLTRYARYRPDDGVIPFMDQASPKGQVTVRCGEVAFYLEKDGYWVKRPDDQKSGGMLGVRYSVRPFERRNNASRLPGTA